MTALIVAGMFIHIYLTTAVLLNRFATKNAIWGELLTVFAIQPLFALWAILGAAVLPPATLSYSAPTLGRLA